MPHWTGCGRNTRDDDARLRDGHGRRIGPSCVGAQAAAEGLELVRAPTSASGYKGVSYAPHSKNIQVIAYFKGKMVTIAKAGRLPETPQEGALAYARWLKRTPGAAAFRQGLATPPLLLAPLVPPRLVRHDDLVR